MKFADTFRQGLYHGKPPEECEENTLRTGPGRPMELAKIGYKGAKAEMEIELVELCDKIRVEKDVAKRIVHAPQGSSLDRQVSGMRTESHDDDDDENDDGPSSGIDFRIEMLPQSALRLATWNVASRLRAIVTAGSRQTRKRHVLGDSLSAHVVRSLQEGRSMIANMTTLPATHVCVRAFHRTTHAATMTHAERSLPCPLR